MSLREYKKDTLNIIFIYNNIKIRHYNLYWVKKIYTKIYPILR